MIYKKVRRKVLLFLSECERFQETPSILMFWRIQRE